MCRSIRPLHNYDPPTTASEVEEAALQYVRKISGMRKPSKANAEPFERAVDEVAEASRRLLDAVGMPVRHVRAAHTEESIGLSTTS